MKRTMYLTALLAVVLLLAVGCERKVTNEIVQDNSGFSGADECMKCHNDADGVLQQAEGEWANSVHASGTSVDYTNRGGGSDCVKCHDHQGFVEWITTDTINPPYSNVSAIHCFTCHAPHENGDFSLRASGPYTLANAVVFDHGNANLCANCHHNRTDVRAEVVANKATTNRFGPHHGPQADLLHGTGGYQHAGYSYTTSTHATAITDACVGCHMGNVQEHDGYTIGGHSFNMVDEETGYTMVKVCTPCHAKATASFNFIADTSHAVSDYDGDGTVEGYQVEFEGMMSTLGALLYSKSVMSRTISGTDTTYTPKSMTVADQGTVGAIWNYMMLEEDRSEGIHNFKYAKDLIKNSIAYINTLP